MNPLMWFLVICFIGAPITAGIIVYRDAKYRGMDAILWALVATLVPCFIGLIIYLAISRNTLVLHCPSCGKTVDKQYALCPYCGTKLKSTCNKCNTPIENGWKICPSCGDPQEQSPVLTNKPRKPSDIALWVLLVFLVVAPILSFLIIILQSYGII